MKNSRFKKYLGLIFITLLWFAFASPYFLQNKVPYPSTYQVDFFSPWSRYSGYDAPVKNNAMPDVITQIYPWKYFTIGQLKNGEIPFWNPYSFSGTPHMANYQSAVFSPFDFFYFILPFLDAWSFIVLLQPLLAGIFTYMYLRQVKVSNAGSLLGAVAFMFSGFMVVWMAYGTLTMAIVFLPLILYFIEKSFEKKSVLPFVGISLFTTCSYLSGHFQTSLYLTTLVVFYTVYKAFLTKDIRSAIFAGISIFLGIVLAMPQILPTFEFYKNSVRDSAYNSGSGIPYYNFVTAFAPDFFGNPVTRNNKFLDYAEWQVFVGILPLFLATFVFWKKSPQSFFLIAAIGTAILALASPLQELIGWLHIPVLSTTVQSRVIVLCSFSLALLAGFGYDGLVELIKKKKYKAIGIRILLVALLVFGIWCWLIIRKPLLVEELSIAKKNLILPTGTFLVASLAIFGTLFVKNRFGVFLLTVLLLGLVSFESFRFAAKWMPFDPRPVVFPDTKVTTFLQKQKEGRIFGNMGGQMEIYYGIPSIEGYDSLYIERYGEFIAAATGTSTPPVNRVVNLARLSKNTDRVLNLLGVSLIFHPNADTKAVWAYPVWNKNWMKPVFKDATYTIFKNTQVMPRAKMFYDYEIIPEKERNIQRFYMPSFDYKNTLLLEEKNALPSSKNATNSVNIVSYTPNTVTIAVNTPKPGMLFLSDSYYPGWEAFIDGKRTKIYKADYAFRAVVVPKGEHTVIFTYIPLSFYGGVILAFASLVGMVVLGKKIKTMQGS